MKLIVLCLLLGGCQSQSPGPLSESEEISPAYYDKNHGVICYTTGTSLSCLQLKD